MSSCMAWNFLWKPGWHLTQRDLSTSASREMGLKACATAPGFVLLFKFSLLCIGYSVARALTCNPSASGTYVLGL